MKERPILFSGPMVKAILDGRKTQTRRTVKLNAAGRVSLAGRNWHIDDPNSMDACPYGKVGDRLWVRESGWQPKEPSVRDLRGGADTWPKYVYSADGISDGEKEQFKDWGWKSKPSIFMPRWASRITLEITGVRVERLQDITVNDVRAEGVEIHSPAIGHASQGIERTFGKLWDKINGKKHPWASNPWVWVVEFQKVEAHQAK